MQEKKAMKETTPLGNSGRAEPDDGTARYCADIPSFIHQRRGGSK